MFIFSRHTSQCTVDLSFIRLCIQMLWKIYLAFTIVTLVAVLWLWSFFKSRSKALFYRCYWLMVCWYSFLFCFYFMLFGEAKQSTFYFLDNNVFTELKKKKMKQVDFYMLTKKQLFFSKQSHRLYRINPELYPVVWTFVFCVSENKWLSSVLVIFLLLVNNLYCWFYLMGVFFSLRSGLFISCHYWWFTTQLKTRRFYLFLNSITITTVTTIKHRPVTDFVLYIYIFCCSWVMWCVQS